MKKVDVRFDEVLLHKWIGKCFEYYQCDTYDFTNSVTQIVGLFIDKKMYALTDIQEPVDYFGNLEDIAVFKVKRCEGSDVKSAFKNREQIKTPINNSIEKIHLINEHQQLYVESELDYDVWLTRGIIFFVEGREVSFEKDTVPFSEEIIINRGYDLIRKFSGTQDFMGGWEKGMTPVCTRSVVEIK